MSYSVFFTLFGLFLNGYSQNLGPVEYCADLFPQRNLSIHKLTGTWFGNEVITHRDMVSGEKPESSCIYVVITEISHQMATIRPKSSDNPREIQTQFGPRAISPDAFRDYRYLKLEWTELEEKLEYIIRYNISRNGFWMTSAPNKPASFGERPHVSFEAFTGTIQVIKMDEHHMLLNFCEILPRHQIFSVILSRRSNSISTDPNILRHLRQLLRSRELPFITQRRVCSGIDSITSSFMLTMVASIMITIRFKLWN